MAANDLPEEIWERILYVVHRPPPVVGTGSTRKDYHQHDLTTVLRLNKRFFDLAGKILYSNPIVDDPLQFFTGLSHPTSTPGVSFKVELLRHVKTLDLTHKQSMEDNTRLAYYDLSEADQVEWENGFFAKSSVDLDNCSKYVDILQSLVIQHHLKNIWQEGIDRLSVGAYDGGWWNDKMAQIQYNKHHRLNKFSMIYINELPTVLWNQLTGVDDEPEESGLELIKVLKPRVIEQYSTLGPMALNNCLYDGAGLSDRTGEVISHLKFDFRSIEDLESLPNIAHGLVNRWYVHIAIGGDGVNRRFEVLDKILRGVSYFLPLEDTGYDDHKQTTLEIYSLEDLLPQQIGRNESPKLSQDIQEFEDKYENWRVPIPDRIDGGRSDQRRIGPWGMMELVDSRIRFVDVYHVEHRLKVVFKR
ncbi:hypothetical protein I302_105356 [Kwoniella bestiolae CBS 10118]|uniref:Uncharacterized protein n=1 Tax=Kwoniella bestiolae CBS 10118 TaxID=1296100 RepID=A0A1B9FSV9_9TREE|nr:hypothetical protein I302_08640 [Kwoniella bestiolae CBS 10118]OCF21861.1 hypothetical protein I302_08640 [Kwoniella bestiolae CBS 10118]